MREATHLGLWGFKPFFVNFASDVFGSNGICSTPSAHSGTHDPIPVVEKTNHKLNRNLVLCNCIDMLPLKRKVTFSFQGSQHQCQAVIILIATKPDIRSKCTAGLALITSDGVASRAVPVCELLRSLLWDRPCIASGGQEQPPGDGCAFSQPIARDKKQGVSTYTIGFLPINHNVLHTHQP